MRVYQYILVICLSTWNFAFADSTILNCGGPVTLDTIQRTRFETG